MYFCKRCLDDLWSVLEVLTGLCFKCQDEKEKGA